MMYKQTGISYSPSSRAEYARGRSCTGRVGDSSQRTLCYHSSRDDRKDITTPGQLQHRGKGHRRSHRSINSSNKSLLSRVEALESELKELKSEHAQQIEQLKSQFSELLQQDIQDSHNLENAQVYATGSGSNHPTIVDDMSAVKRNGVKQTAEQCQTDGLAKWHDHEPADFIWAAGWLIVYDDWQQGYHRVPDGNMSGANASYKAVQTTTSEPAALQGIDVKAPSQAAITRALQQLSGSEGVKEDDIYNMETVRAQGRSWEEEWNREKQQWVEEQQLEKDNLEKQLQREAAALEEKEKQETLLAGVRNRQISMQFECMRQNLILWGTYPLIVVLIDLSQGKFESAPWAFAGSVIGYLCTRLFFSDRP